ncbi:MAG: 50S ribosomal protein L29 [Candidatus Nomurabacteria bacterium]|jgi:ribosomal protein L29|nr:50S ribosomal protein L29 [Candidatus Nomurabacteria bacterium]
MAKKQVKKITASDKKTVANPVVDLRTKTVKELHALLVTARTDLLASQKSLKANELVNPCTIKKQRKEIARILTIITEKHHSEVPVEKAPDTQDDKQVDKRSVKKEKK